MTISREVVHLPVRSRELPSPGKVEVWLADLSRLPLDAGPAGMSRRERVIRRRIQQQFLLRLLLGAYLGMPGKDVLLARSPSGKPGLAPGMPRQGLQFNLSHSGGWIVLAMTREHPLGVDIEVDRRLARPRALARRYFSAAEAGRLDGLEEPALSRAFLELWTAKESVIKAAGGSVARNLGRVRVAPGFPPALAELPEEWNMGGAWLLERLDLPERLLGHLACPASPGRVHMIELAQPGNHSGIA